jgi:RNase P/RNase MRP subunit p29
MKRIEEISQTPLVFISYNHNDMDLARRIRYDLTSNNIRVLIDTSDMMAGEKIVDFIESSIKKCNVVVSVVSRKSLISGWVGFESINSLYAKKYLDKKFIVVFKDNEFFELSFKMTATIEIDNKISEIDNLINEHRKLKIDTLELDTERNRLFDLRNSLGKILDSLKSQLCLDFSDEINYNKNIDKLIFTILNR